VEAEERLDGTMRARWQSKNHAWLAKNGRAQEIATETNCSAQGD
jgi:hypothetical protein